MIAIYSGQNVWFVGTVAAWTHLAKRFPDHPDLGSGMARRTLICGFSF